MIIEMISCYSDACRRRQVFAAQDSVTKCYLITVFYQREDRYKSKGSLFYYGGFANPIKMREVIMDETRVENP